MSVLIRLVYASRATFKPAQSSAGIEPTVARILLQSRRNNPRQQIGGVLYYGNGYFFQCLEGQSDVVNALSVKIMQDERHSDFQILKASPVDSRLFSNWSMKYIPLEKDVGTLLRKHGVNSFNPFEFNHRLIDDLVELFASIGSPESQPDQHYQAGSERRPSLLRRLLRGLGLG